MNEDNAMELSDGPTRTNLGNSGVNVNFGQNGRQSNVQCNGSSMVVILNPINYEGECESVGMVLGLRVEWFNKKASYEQFI